VFLSTSEKIETEREKVSFFDVGEVELPLWTSVLFNLCWHEDSAFVGFVGSAEIYQLYKIFATRRVCLFVKLLTLYSLKYF
jgi:hypothetical protein